MDTTEFSDQETTMVDLRIMNAIAQERQRQDEKWGIQNHGDGKWAAILMEEVGEVATAILHNDPKNLREELIQVAAVAAAWVEALDRRQG
jgi:NTP pyrophosphatase (non-canonical NTP hydrolase)